MENKGLADTHEVIPYQDGFALQRKGAQLFPQDLFDPLGLNEKFVTTEETPAPESTQAAPSASSGFALLKNKISEFYDRVVSTRPKTNIRECSAVFQKII